MEIDLEDSGRLLIDQQSYLIPELQLMVGFDQKSPHHPERDLLKHTQQVLRLAKKYYKKDPSLRDELLIAAVFHDIAKPVCWQVNKKDPEFRTFYGHDIEGSKMFKEIDARFGLSVKHGFSQSKVTWLIEQHIRICKLDNMRIYKQDQLKSHALFKELEILRDCDTKGRKP